MSSGRPTRPSAVCAAIMALTCGVVAHGPAAEIRRDGSRCAITFTAMRAGAEFLGHVPAEHLDGALHRRVRRIARQREARKPAGNIDDAAAVDDQRQQLLRQKKNALEMDVDQFVELRFGGVAEIGMNADSGIVDQVIEPFALPGLEQHLSQSDRELTKPPLFATSKCSACARRPMDMISSTAASASALPLL